jgi:uncharacterized protein (TIGR04255 family)
VFPLFERSQTPSITLPPQIAQLLGHSVSPVAYTFLTEDRATTLMLSPEALSLTTSAYSRWEDFRGRLQNPLTALAEIYQPSFFSRIGLRYVDAIQRERLGLEGQKWSQLLRRELLGELALPQFEDSLEQAERVLRLKFPDGSGSILLRHGLGQVQGQSETGYVIDFDFYTDKKTEVADGGATLDRFNRRAGRAFRWCILDNLHHAMEPREVAHERT